MNSKDNELHNYLLSIGFTPSPTAHADLTKYTVCKGKREIVANLTDDNIFWLSIFLEGGGEIIEANKYQIDTVAQLQFLIGNSCHLKGDFQLPASSRT